MAVRRAVQQADSALPEEIEEHWYNRVGAIVGFGNAIVPQLWAVFIRCAEEARREVTP